MSVDTIIETARKLGANHKEAEFQTWMRAQSCDGLTRQTLVSAFQEGFSGFVPVASLDLINGPGRFELIVRDSAGSIESRVFGEYCGELTMQLTAKRGNEKGQLQVRKGLLTQDVFAPPPLKLRANLPRK